MHFGAGIGTIRPKTHTNMMEGLRDVHGSEVITGATANPELNRLSISALTASKVLRTLGRGRGIGGNLVIRG